MSYKVTDHFLMGWDHAIARINRRAQETYQEASRTPEWRFFKLTRLHNKLDTLHELSSQLHEEWMDAEAERHVRVS